MAIGIVSLGSGSKGNCTLISNGKTHILIDAGLPVSAIGGGLRKVGLTLGDVDAVLLTHEHEDHVKGVESLAADIPVYSHAYTLEEIQRRMYIPLANQMDIDEKGFSIGALDVLPFAVSHDAVYPLGYAISDWEDKFTYITDTGYISKGVKRIASGSGAVMMESNHDRELLLRGGYPVYLKKRIMSETGHLCNEESALFALDLIRGGAGKIILAHISENNNLPELAYWTTKRYLRENGVEDGAYDLRCALQKQVLAVNYES